MPPVECWIFLTLVSTTNWPPATTAPDRVEVAAHRPMVPPKRAIMATPPMVDRRRIRWWTEVSSGSLNDQHLTNLSQVSGGRPAPAAGAGCRRRIAFHDGLQDLVARSDGLDAALFHDGDLVDLAERGRAVGDDDDDAAALPHREDGLVQGLVAGAVEAGIGLVEHDQERVAVEGAGKRDALALAAREEAPPSPMRVS